MVKLNIKPEPIKTHKIGKYLHSTFFEYLGKAIYDGIWVGMKSEIPNIEGLRKDVIDGCIEAGIGAVRWPGGCCADHYHWKDGIGSERKNRIHPIPTTSGIWCHDFGTDEFIKFCRLIGAEPIIIANAATGTPAEFLEWFEYCNGDSETKYGAMRSVNGHKEPYNVRIWGIGNTDENVWHIDFNNPIAYAQTYLKFTTAIRELRNNIHIIGLGLSERHMMPEWVGPCLDYITFKQTKRGPDSLSVHHYIGGGKGRYRACGNSVDYSDDAYYYTLDSLKYYQKDIDLHKDYINKYTLSKFKTTICFDEWGLQHPEATLENGIRQVQTMRDAIFAACTLHLFYRNSDIVEFAMQTQLSNVVQSLFETNGAAFYKTPTFYIFKLFKEHIGQNLVNLDTENNLPMLDVLSSISTDKKRITTTLVNKDLYNPLKINLVIKEEYLWRVEKADIIAPDSVRYFNSFDKPDVIKDQSLAVNENLSFILPRHSVARVVLVR